MKAVILVLQMKKSLLHYFEEFLYECEFVHKSRPETLRGHKQIFATFTKLMPDVTLETLSSPTIMNFFKILQERQRIVGKGHIRMGIKKSTLATYWNKLNGFFKWLVIKKHLKINPFEGMKYPMPVYENRKFLKREQIERILAAILSHTSKAILLKRNLVIFYLLLYCGLRREELLLLQLRDIDFERKTITIRAETSKSGRTRILPLHSTVILHIKDYLKERKDNSTSFLIASTMRDDGLSYVGLKQFVEKIKRITGIHFHVHQFRHTFAVNFLKQSNNIAKLKQLMGHKDIRMTMVYLRCLPTNEMRGDIEALSIDELI